MTHLIELLSRFRSFESEAHQILASIEASPQSRSINLTETIERVALMSAQQKDMLRQSLRCCEMGVFRASHVMAWSALIDRVQEIIASDGFLKLNTSFPRWDITDIEKLRENHTEYSQIQAAKKIGILRKAEEKALHGLLSKRNECAHPSDFYPDLNQTLGYVAEVIFRFEKLDRHN